MKKKYAFNVLSAKKCSDCPRRLKLRLVEQRKPKNITRCYRCGRQHKHAEQMRKDHDIRQQELISNPEASN